MQCELIPQPEEMRPITFQNIPCISTEMLADAYQVDAALIRNNFIRNKERFTEGKHFFTLSGSDLKELKNRVSNCYSVKIGRNTKAFTLWTERGAARHAKMLNSDKAWEVFELLEETFFQTIKPVIEASSSLAPDLRAELKALVDAKLSSCPQNMHRKARSEMWTRFNRHFKIAEYSQLPHDKMPEARDYIINIQLKALSAQSLPPVQQALLPAPAIASKTEALKALFSTYEHYVDDFAQNMRKFSCEYRRLTSELAREASNRALRGHTTGTDSMFVYSLLRDAYDLETMGNSAQEKFSFCRRFMLGVDKMISM
jgi:hypothetical protein